MMLGKARIHRPVWVFKGLHCAAPWFDSDTHCRHMADAQT